MTPACERLRPAIEALSEGGDAPDDEALGLEAAGHLEVCAACQAAVEATDALRAELARAVPMPPADVWQTFDAELRERLAATSQERAGRLLRLRALRRHGGPLLAAAAVVLLSLGVFAFRVAEPTVTVRGIGRVPVYSLPYGDPTWQPRERGRVDPSRVEGLAATELTLSPAAKEVLLAHGVVQVPAGTERLADLYPLAPPPDAPPALATADASLLLAGAAASRAALALEADVIAPGLRELLAHALRELRALESGTRDAAARRATRRARELLGVAAVLAGVDPRLPHDGAGQRVREEALRGLAGRPYASTLLGREVDARALAPRGLFAGEPELHGHARAAAWLQAAALTLDRARPDDVRAAGMIALALASGRGERRTALDLQARLEAALEVLYGEPDGLTPLDMLEVLRQGLATEALTPAALAAPGAVERLAERAALVAAARGKERVGPPGPPTLRLLGGTRSLEGLALTRLAPPALARPHPTSLDLLVLLGSRRARTVVSALELDAPGYDAATEALGELGRAWADASRAVPARTCLEQARLWSAAALVAPSGGAGAAPVTPGVYDDRLLLAALAALNAPPPSPPTVADAPGSAPAEQGPAPLVEPLPRLHARLAFTSERLARVVDDLIEGRVAPRARAAAAALRRVARLEEALRDASLAALDGRAPGPDTLAALRDYAPALRALGPARATSAEDVYVERGGQEQETAGEVRVLHRVVHALDRLHLVVVDPASGRPVLAVGAALAASERWTRGDRLVVPDRDPGDHDPAWAVHVVRR